MQFGLRPKRARAPLITLSHSTVCSKQIFPFFISLSLRVGGSDSSQPVLQAVVQVWSDPSTWSRGIWSLRGCRPDVLMWSDPSNLGEGDQIHLLWSDPGTSKLNWNVWHVIQVVGSALYIVRLPYHYKSVPLDIPFHLFSRTRFIGVQLIWVRL